MSSADLQEARLDRSKRALRALVTPEGRENLHYEWRRRRQGIPELPRGEIVDVIVICKGNVCRSPFAAELLQQAAPQLRVSGGGLHTEGGVPAEAGAIRVGREFGLNLSEHRSRDLSLERIRQADLLLGMEGWQVAEVERRCPGARAKTFLVGDFSETRPHTIFDPWGRPDEDFRLVFQRIRAGLQGLLERIAATTQSATETSTP